MPAAGNLAGNNLYRLLLGITHQRHAAIAYRLVRRTIDAVAIAVIRVFDQVLGLNDPLHFSHLLPLL
jgi:hypothetical protein